MMFSSNKILHCTAAALAIVIAVVVLKNLRSEQSQRSSWLRRENPSLAPPTSKSGGGKIALVRPASPYDVDPLLSSFDLWLESKFPPCGKGQIKPDGDRQLVDLIISFSRQTEGTKKMAKAVHEIFEQTNGWDECFDKMFVVNCGISEEDDIYRYVRELPSNSTIHTTLTFYAYCSHHSTSVSEASQDTNFMWVNGPNQQVRHV